MSRRRAPSDPVVVNNPRHPAATFFGADVFQHPDIEKVVLEIKQRVAPQLGFWFIALAVAISFFHESNPFIVGGVVFFWIFVMGFTDKVDLRAWRPPIRLSVKWIAFFLLYLAIGFVWSFAKLFLHIYRGHLTSGEMALLHTCMEHENNATRQDCFVELTYSMQTTIFIWVLYWPLNIIYTFVQDPVRIALDIGYQHCEQLYGRIAGIGGEWLFARTRTPVNA